MKKETWNYCSSLVVGTDASNSFYVELFLFGRLGTSVSLGILSGVDLFYMKLLPQCALGNVVSGK